MVPPEDVLVEDEGDPDHIAESSDAADDKDGSITLDEAVEGDGPVLVQRRSKLPEDKPG